MTKDTRDQRPETTVIARNENDEAIQSSGSPRFARDDEERISWKTVMKFDAGADGFLKMIYVLIIFSFLILGTGIYFLINTFS